MLLYVTATLSIGAVGRVVSKMTAYCDNAALICGRSPVYTCGYVLGRINKSRIFSKTQAGMLRLVSCSTVDLIEARVELSRSLGRSTIGAEGSARLLHEPEAGLSSLVLNALLDSGSFRQDVYRS